MPYVISYSDDKIFCAHHITNYHFVFNYHFTSYHFDSDEFGFESQTKLKFMTSTI